MSKETLERLAFIASHRILAMQSQESLAISANQWATPGKRRSLAVERIAATISEVFEGMEQAELAQMMGEGQATEAKERG